MNLTNLDGSDTKATGLEEESNATRSDSFPE